MSEPDNLPKNEETRPVPDPARPAMIGKRVTIREDGRYVIYYDFAPRADAGESAP